MPLLYYIQNSLTGIILVSILLFYVLGQGGRRQVQDSLFVALLISALLIIIFELAVDIFSGRTFQGSRFILTLVTYIFYIINPLPSVLYLLYLDQLRRQWVRIPRSIGVVAFAPAIVGLLLATASLFNGMIFSFDTNNVYLRGDYFYLIIICDLLGFVFGMIYLLVYRESFKKKDFPFFLFFPFPVLIATVFQISYFGLEAVGLSLAVTLLIAYLKMESTQANKDYLTLLYNRRVSEQYLQHLLHRKKKNKVIGGIMLDINSFKRVNDQYGHDLGDRSLRFFSKILVESFRNNWFIGRYGGDEFILFKEIDSIEDLKENLENFSRHLLHFNAQQELPFSLSCSTGYAVYIPANDMDSTEFIKLLDKLMYDHKREYYTNKIEILDNSLWSEG